MRQIASVNFKKTFIFSCLFKEDFLRVHQIYLFQKQPKDPVLYDALSIVGL